MSKIIIPTTMPDLHASRSITLRPVADTLKKAPTKIHGKLFPKIFGSTKIFVINCQ